MSQSDSGDARLSPKEQWRRTCDTCLRVMDDNELRMIFAMRAGYGGDVAAESPMCMPCAQRTNLAARVASMCTPPGSPPPVTGYISAPPVITDDTSHGRVYVHAVDDGVDVRIALGRADAHALAAANAPRCTITSCHALVSVTVADLTFCAEHAPPTLPGLDDHVDDSEEEPQ